MKALDLFCGAGGVTRGLQMAGFHVTGVDLHPQPRYIGDVFHQADAMTFQLEDFDFIWASPPCLKFTSLKSMPNAKEHEDLLTPTRERLKLAGVPYVIENVPGAPLNRGCIMLCGTMFGLGVKAAGAELRRHRWFESSFAMLAPDCRHNFYGPQTVGVYGAGGPNYIRGFGEDRTDKGKIRRPATVGVWGNAGGISIRDNVQQFSTEERREAMGIDWMVGKELSQAIPPAYSKFIAEQFLQRGRQ